MRVTIPDACALRLPRAAYAPSTIPSKPRLSAIIQRARSGSRTTRSCVPPWSAPGCARWSWCPTRLRRDG